VKVRPRPTELLFLFAVGAGGALIGDAGNVQEGVTRYLDDSVPFVWESPLWFPVLVGLAAAATGVLRLELGPPRPGFDPRILIGAWAATVGIYAVTSVVPDDGLASTALVTMLGILVACFVADRPALICGIAAAVAGPVVEIAIVELEYSEYTRSYDGLGGVALLLPGLYLAFGVSVARITEQLVAWRDRS
jgi:hypothetical protein